MSSQSTKEIAATIRKNLKKEFPECKFSVTVQHHRSITVALMQAPFKVFADGNPNGSRADRGYVQLNHYYLNDQNVESRHYETGELLRYCNGGVVFTQKAWNVLCEVVKFGLAEHWDESDSMTDYFNCNYYFDLHIGKWDKPVIEGEQVEEVAPVVVEEVAPVVVEEVAPVVVAIAASRADVRASRAFDGTSFSPERREQSAVDGYIEYMQQVAAEFQQYATAENVDRINAALETFRAGYAQRYNAYLSAHGRIFSQMITGSGGWTGRMVRSMEKKNATCDNRRNEWLEWDKKTIARLRNQFNPRAVEHAPIMSGDHDALEKLQEKIAKLEKLQQWMKDSNAVIRKHKAAGKEAQAAALVEMGHNPIVAAKLVQSDSVWEIGYADYQLKNNNANIRRLKQRLVDVERLKETPVTELQVSTDEESEESIRIVDNTDENRIQIFFPGKPTASVRDGLKSSGFRWAPSNGCWQAFRNQRAMNRAKEIVKGSPANNCKINSATKK